MNERKGCGTYAAYNQHGCRCGECRAFMAVEKAKRRGRALSMSPPSGGWQDRAVCRGVATEVFFPVDNYGRMGDQQRQAVTAAAKAHCARCEVTADCLAYALAQPLSLTGVWGGLDEVDRQRLRRQQVAS